jgi:hypothetical protein
MVYYKDYCRNFRNKKDEAPPFANKFFKALTKPEQTNRPTNKTNENYVVGNGALGVRDLKIFYVKGRF